MTKDTMTQKRKFKIGALIECPRHGTGIVIRHYVLGPDWYQVEWARSGKCGVVRDVGFKLVA